MKYEYIVQAMGMASVSETAKLMSSLGKDGWELVSVAMAYDQPVLYFKREIKK